MTSTSEQTIPNPIFVDVASKAIDFMENPTPVVKLLYYTYADGVAETIFGKSRFALNVAVCQANIEKALNVFDSKKSVYSDASIQYDIVVYKTDTYAQDKSVYISLYSKHGMAQFNAGVMTLPTAPIVVNTVCANEADATDVIMETITEHVKTLRMRLAESIKV
jgi:hypothetical protein